MRIKRTCSDRILIKLDPVEEKVGSIFVTEGGDFRKATVLQVGPGLRRGDGIVEVPDVRPGERVVLSRAHAEHGSGKRMLMELGGEHLLIQPKDILFVMEEEVEVA